MAKFTPNFSVAEFAKHLNDLEFTDVFGNINSFTLFSNLLRLSLMLQHLRDYLVSKKVPNARITVNSWYRNIAHNKAVGGVSTSQHLTGEAVDVSFKSPYIQNLAVDYIKDNFDFGQLIIYPSFIHLSLADDKHHNQIIYKK